MAIPKNLHQIWIGPDPRPAQMIDGWTRKHETWSHFVWNERALNKDIKWTRGTRAVYDRYMRDGRYCGAANVARVLILHQYGGVYIDADMVCRHTIEGAWFMQHDAWISQSPHDPNRSQNAAMGASGNNILLSRYINDLDQLGLTGGEIHPSWQKTGALLFDQVRIWADGIEPKPDLAIVPSPAFHPHKKNGAVNDRLFNYEGIIYADHKFYSTHGRKMSV